MTLAEKMDWGQWLPEDGRPSLVERGKMTKEEARKHQEFKWYCRGIPGWYQIPALKNRGWLT